MDKTESERICLLKAVFAASPDIITVTSLQTGIILDVNDEFCKRTGYQKDYVLGKSSVSLDMWVEIDRRNEYRSLLLRDGAIREFEARLRHKSGEIRIYQLSASIVEIGHDPTIVTIFRDVTDSKLAEEASVRNAIQLERAEEMAKIGSWEFDYATKTVVGSAGAARIYGVPHNRMTVETIEGVPLPEYRPMMNQARDDLIQRGLPYDVQFKIRRQTDGEILDIHSKARWDPGKKQLFGILRDITEENRIEAGLHEAIANRDVLIRELYHRINNLLQIIVSLLSLEDERDTGHDYSSLIERMTRRVRAVARVHQSLYESRNLSRIDLSGLLPRLAGDLMSLLPPAGSDLDFRFDTDDAYINIDAAVPCGIILAELVHNAAVHAYSPGTRGIIRLSSRRDEGGTVEIVVSDDGKGMHLDVNNLPPACLGLRLAKDLAKKQLGGTIRFSNEPGCTCTIRFRDDHLVERV